MNRLGGVTTSIILIATACALHSAGCSEPRPPLVVTDPDPNVKIPAIKIAVHRHDISSERQMVKDLESDDPAVRFYAIYGLQKLTGKDLGYLYYQDAEERAPAAKRWQAWLRDREVPASQPADSTGTDSESQR